MGIARKVKKRAGVRRYTLKFMAASFREMQPVLAYMAAHLEEDISLRTLGARTGRSPFHLQRVFARAVGETPKQFSFRLRLGRAAALLLATDESILDIALGCGFQSHETFSRAFRRRFGRTPSAYRKRGFAHATDGPLASGHAAAVDAIGPCVGLYHIHAEAGNNSMTYSITKKQLAPQPVLVLRRTVKRSEIAATIAQSLPRIFLYAQQNGIALVGQPFTRYVKLGAGLVTMEPGMCMAAGAASLAPAAENQVSPDMLPAGEVANTTHSGPYDKLSDAYAAMEEWFAAEGIAAGTGFWEVYTTDPADFPDPKDWKTEVYWPLA